MASDSSSVRAFMRIDGLALVEHLDAPIDAGLALRRDLDDLSVSACVHRALAASCRSSSSATCDRSSSSSR